MLIKIFKNFDLLRLNYIGSKKFGVSLKTKKSGIIFNLYLKLHGRYEGCNFDVNWRDWRKKTSKLKISHLFISIVSKITQCAV